MATNLISLRLGQSFVFVDEHVSNQKREVAAPIRLPFTAGRAPSLIVVRTHPKLSGRLVFDNSQHTFRFEASAVDTRKKADRKFAGAIWWQQRNPACLT